MLLLNVCIDSDDYVADEAVKKAILQWKFTPAIGTDQKAHESIIGMTITLPKQAVKAK